MDEKSFTAMNNITPPQSPNSIQTPLGPFPLLETVRYPNGGFTYFYGRDGIAILIDQDICAPGSDNTIFSYRSITNKQNEYMSRYKRVYRLLSEDMSKLDELLTSDEREEVGEEEKDVAKYAGHQADRADQADVSPLEMKFENLFTNVYGKDSTKYLWKEYAITDDAGHTKFLDYYVRTRTGDGDLAIEENGVNYHHPQIIGLQRYREQLNKQNLCTNRNIKLFRFSTEDCQFEERIEDDIKSYLGPDTNDFQERGILVDRSVSCMLYEHQQATLDAMQQQRRDGVKSFLIVFPTASGKSKIVEEDIQEFCKSRENAQILILGPNRDIKNDWYSRVENSLAAHKEQIEIHSYAYMERHYMEYAQDHFRYIVVDEAHHAVAPGLKRTIQYFQPEFLVGLTATDQRPDRKKLESVFGAYQVGMSLQEAMEKGIIANANAFRVETNIDLSKVRINGKDYVNADLEKTIRISSRNELIVDVLKKYFCEGAIGDRQGLIFCVNVQHTLEMERLLNNAGMTARSYTSKSKNPEQIMEDFKEHKIRFLCTCQMISEGWDYPELGILVMARPTLSKVLYLQQLGRGLRKTSVKKNVFVIDVVDEYGSMVRPCSLHAIFHNPYYVPFGDVARRNYEVGDMIVVDGLQERIERIVEIDTSSFDEKYGDYLSEEQLARRFFLSTGTIRSWIKKNKISPTVSFVFGSKTLYLFSPEDADRIRTEQHIPDHSDETIRDDFWKFLEERDYSMSYKMVFLTSFINHMDASGDANIGEVLADYTTFYRERIEKGLPVDRKNCPFTLETLADEKYVKRNMLSNPFEKFERKRFFYYSKDLNILSMNHALHARLTEQDYKEILDQMKQDLEDYYASMNK